MDFCKAYGLCDWGCVRGILGNLVLSAHRVWSYHLGVRVVLVTTGCVFLIFWQTLEIVFVSFDLRKLVCGLFDLDRWMECGPMSKCVNSYVIY